MPTRLSDVAAKVNLSPALVSKVLNNRSDVWASEETRRRVFAAAREMGYRPSAAARSLRSGKTHTVAFVFPLPNPHRDIIEAFAEHLCARDYRLLVQAVPDQEQALAQLAEIARARVCDAVILWGSDAQVEQQGCLLEDLKLPFVVKGRFENTHPAWPQADFDHEAMMAQAVERLVARGHRRIAYMGYIAEDAFRFHLQRGFEDAMGRLLGGPVRPDLMVSALSGSPDFEAAMTRWLQLPPDEQPTAVVIGAGLTAWQGIEMALARVGRRIGDGPYDVAVAGTGGPDLTLLAGEGQVYRHMESLDLAGALVERLLVPVLLGEPIEERIVRLHPSLLPVPSLRLLDHGFRLPQPRADGTGLVVTAVIAALAAILFPMFAQAHDTARQAACLSATQIYPSVPASRQPLTRSC